MFFPSFTSFDIKIFVFVLFVCDYFYVKEKLGKLRVLP